MPDPQRRFVVVDILEKCHVWWQPMYTFQGGPKVLLHTVLELKTDSMGKMRICYQYDHTMWLESLLYHNMPHFVGEFFKHTHRPFMGALTR